MAEPTKPRRVGLIRVRNHCTFSWQEDEAGGLRSIAVQANHCSECVVELRKQGYVLVQDGAEGPAAGTDSF